jgi:ferritin
MMLTNTLESALNEQIKHELYSSYFYLAMSAWSASNNLSGAAKWLAMQAKEEQGHALKIYEFILDRGGKVTLQAISQPPATYTSLLDVFQQVQKHETDVTTLVNRLYETACRENDYPTQFFLQWFVNEQVEEEKTAAGIVAILQSVGVQGAALFQIDRMLAARA